MLLFFMTTHMRKFAKQSYSYQVIKKRLLTSFSLLEEGEIDDSADQCTEDTHGDEGKD